MLVGRGKPRRSGSCNRSSWLEITEGGSGYLREAYHGEPYATTFLCAEAFDNDRASAPIAANVLRGRLPEALRLAEERLRTIYKATTPAEDASKLPQLRCALRTQGNGDRRAGNHRRQLLTLGLPQKAPLWYGVFLFLESCKGWAIWCGPTPFAPSGLLPKGVLSCSVWPSGQFFTPDLFWNSPPSSDANVS